MEQTSSTNALLTSTELQELTPFQEIKQLHARCGIYTNERTVKRILDAVGWTEKADLRSARLLEAAAGDGAFVVEAAKRVIQSFRKRGEEPAIARLRDRITAYEIHYLEAKIARRRVAVALRGLAVSKRIAESCAKAWVKTGDFLLTPPDGVYTHTVGNPPYIRWAKVPPGLKAKYQKALARDMTGGDLFLPFLDRALDCLAPGGICGFLCSDRWRFMAFAEAFRTKWLPKLDISDEVTVSASDAFVRDVDSYPNILIAKKSINKKPVAAPSIKSRRTLSDLGYAIKVGPALGCTSAYVLQPGEDDVEQELLHPWLDGSEISEGKIEWRGRRVVGMYTDKQKLVTLAHYPMLYRRLRRFETQLKARSIFLNGARWCQPIDRLYAPDWKRPKLLIPELAKVPRAAVDRTGAIPSHGVYAIFSPNDDVDALYELLGEGKLAAALTKIAPRVKGDYIRCYRRFLNMISFG